MSKIYVGRTDDNGYYFAKHQEKTVWKDTWNKYLGKYQISFYAPLLLRGKLALYAGTLPGAFVKVSRTGNGMAIDDMRLLEYEPGLFFSIEGEALDFRSEPPTWRNIKLQKR